jgi:ribonuclease BN (tRNA processing enzyme)
MAAGPGLRAGWGFPGQNWEADVVAVELSDGDAVTLDGLEVTVAENTHFTVPAGEDRPPSAVSLSFRFDASDRSVVYSGDTGPNDALVELARSADLLISEMIDDELALAAMRPPGAPPPPADRQPTVLGWHMDEHHMTPLQVGELANAAGVGRLVITHFAPAPSGPEQAQAYLDAIAEHYEGDAELGTDLGRY